MLFKAGVKTAGRKKGTPNKITRQLKEMILEAAELAGGEGGVVAYLKEQAKRNPQAFMSLLGKVLPLQIQGDPENPLHVEHSDARDRLELIIAKQDTGEDKGPSPRTTH